MLYPPKQKYWHSVEFPNEPPLCTLLRAVPLQPCLVCFQSSGSSFSLIVNMPGLLTGSRQKQSCSPASALSSTVMRTFAIILALAALASNVFAAACEIPIYVQACTTDLNGCSAPVWQEFGHGRHGLPCSTTVSDAQEKVEQILRTSIQNPVKKPSQVTLGACNLDSPDNHFSKSARTASRCSPIRHVNHQILQHAAGLSTSVADDAGFVEVLVGAVRFVLDGLVETSALQVATLASIRSSIKTLTRMERPLVFQYIPSPDWLKRSHEPSRFSVPLMNDTVHDGGLEGWAPAHTAEYVPLTAPRPSAPHTSPSQLHPRHPRLPRFGRRAASGVLRAVGQPRARRVSCPALQGLHAEPAGN